MIAIVLPTGSDHDRTRFPIATLTLVGIHTVAFLVLNLTDPERLARLFGFVAADPLAHQFVTWLFVHDWWPRHFDLGWYWYTRPLLVFAMHMLFLWFAGSDLEDVLGPVKLLLLFFGGGVATVLMAWWIGAAGHLPNLDRPMFGPSGAICAMLGLYVVRFPRFKVRVWYGVWMRSGIARISSLVFIVAYLLMELTRGIVAVQSGGTHVAGWGGLGSFALGMILGLLTRQSRHGREEFLFKEADHLFFHQKWHAAMDYYRRVTERNQRATEAFVKWALCWECSGMYKRAERVLADALALYTERGWHDEAETIRRELEQMQGRGQPVPVTGAESNPRAPAEAAAPNLLFRKEIKWKGKAQ
jgi:membrane associated rhomboid family serine protease